MSNPTLPETIKTIRHHILTATTLAGSGHPTSSLSAVELLSVMMFDGHFVHDFTDEDNVYNDRLIFSKGHASPLLYSLLTVSGAISYDDLLSLRKFGSKIEGHPVPPLPGIDVASGSLGQGISVGLGVTLGMKLHLVGETPNRLPRVYVVLGDSECAEGQVWEAAEVAGYYKASQLVAILDVNRLGQRGETMLGWDIETYGRRFESFGWNVILVENGNNLDEVKAAFSVLEETLISTEKPTIIIAKTVKGSGISFLENADNWHGKAVPKDQLEAALSELGEVNTALIVDVPKPEQSKNRSSFEISNLDFELPKSPSFSGLVATREAYGDALVHLCETDSRIVVLDAETSNSTFADKVKASFSSRFFEMFIAEQNMVSVALGLSVMGFVPYVSSFAAFLTRAFDQIRMIQYSSGNVKICGSHAGVSIGTDGSSQMGLEDLSMMKSILKSIVLYPSDAISTEKLLFETAQETEITYIRTTREKTPLLYSPDDEFPIGGSKTVISHDYDTTVIFAAGITLHESVKAARDLESKGISVAVIDMYSVKPLDTAVIAKFAKNATKIIVVEDHYPHGGLGESIKAELTGFTGEIIHLCVTQIPHSGQPSELLAFEEIDAAAIKKAVVS